jgi:hypothetical protein
VYKLSQKGQETRHQDGRRSEKCRAASSILGFHSSHESVLDDSLPVDSVEGDSVPVDAAKRL